MRKRIAMAQGDMTGDGAAETVILTGEQREGTAYWQNIELEIIDGAESRFASLWHSMRAMNRSSCWAA